MRVPSSTPQDNQPSDSKAVSYNDTTTTTNLINNNNSSVATVTAGGGLGFNEPTSVLDLRGSPSPAAAAADKPPVAVAGEVSGGGGTTGQVSEQFPLDEHVMRSMDWDSIMRELELDDDSAPALKSSFTTAAIPTHYGADSQLPSFPDQLHPADFESSEVYLGHQIGGGHGLNSVDVSDGFVNGGFDFIEDLIRVVDCVDSDELQLAQVVLARLNQRLRSPSGRPLKRAAFYFKEALATVLSGSTRNPTRLSSWSDIVHRIRAYKEFSGISPVPLFSHFTVNQAILDSLNWQSSSLSVAAASTAVPFVHVVDFEIGFGGQYASLMREIAEKSSVSGGFLRVTAVVPENYAVETRLVKENLSLFAADLKIRFQIEFVLVRTFEMLSFKAIRFVEGERTVVLLSPTIFRHLSGISGFIHDLRRVSPKVVVFVDGEGWTETSGAGSFRREFVGGLEFYTMVLESLDAAVPPGESAKKIIEAFILQPRITEAVEAAAARRHAGEMTWREALCAAGMRPMPLSQFADFQAECLLEKAHVGGFHVAKRQAELVLCWHGRALVATSAWRF
ncbi:PREDICTED: scarecrow-like protein 15 [Tarenaya hassleriana]|uniref:scarecrow-like protein 15 n=1 Tax=Tarenaya hassleriana TaxID=28532 RepID=UPI00053CA70F|nr:PREDICTED: scarecrow-like protein 15 [Tarenaya hassleriana]